MDYDWQFGVLLCKLNHFISHASVQSTCLTLTAMTIYRCNLIIKNENIKNRTIKRDNSGRRNVLIVTIIIWTSMDKFLNLFGYLLNFCKNV